MTTRIQQLLIDRAVIDSPHTQGIMERIDAPFQIINHPKEVFAYIMAWEDPVQAGKEVLYITRNKGKFIKKCPGTKLYNCCGYMILHIGTFCTMDCSYCILQSYFHPPVLQYFVNKNRMFDELNQVFESSKVKRIGTGEFTDSLIWEPWTNITDELIPLFARQNTAILELKSKTVAIQNLHAFDHRQKTIMAWSLNTQRIIDTEEKSTTSLEQRLEAAKKCQTMGYPLAFHFDPIVLYEGCEEEYRKVIDKLFQNISEESIVWISLGTFRFMPDLKQIIQYRFPASKIIYGEFIPGMDNKMRYFKPLRIAFYKQLVRHIRDVAPNVLVYFCMEDEEVWQKTMGFIPKEKGGLAAILDRSAVSHCGLHSFGPNR